MPRLARITVYPIKSLPGMSLDSVRILPSGALADDRRWALIDDQDQIINAKRCLAIHRLDSRFQLAQGTIELRDRQQPAWYTFHIDADRPAMLEFIGSVLGQRVRLIEDAERGLPDDPDAPGPTVVATASLAAIAGWFPGMGIDEARGRFRANLEIDGDEPFWEDRLIGPQGVDVRFQVGPVALLGVNPCQRCAVPTRDPASGEVTPSFAKIFSTRREASLGPDAPREQFDHFYRLSVNTRLPIERLGGTIRVGNEVTIG